MKTDLIERNMSLSLEFSRYLLDHPEVEARIPEGAYVVLLPMDSGCAPSRALLLQVKVLPHPRRGDA